MVQFYTYEDYAQMSDDGNRYELVDGVLQMMTPAPGTKHQQILRRLTKHFEQDCSQNGEFFFAPIDVIFSPDNTRQPDFVFITNERLGIVTERGIEGSPDLLVEILSPSTAQNDKTTKRDAYERFGVKEYWIIDPAYELLEQFVLTEHKYILHRIYKPDEMVASPFFTCIRISVHALFV